MSSAVTAAPPAPPSAASSTTTATAAKNDKDRPRRRKARRACFACQRAHLTCGDERPCQRCIKRGLQDACHDGIRKKAKYLHDAPGDDPSADRNQPSSMGFRQPQLSTSQMPSQFSSMQPPAPDGTVNPNSIGQSPISPIGQQSSAGLQGPHSAVTAGPYAGFDSDWFDFNNIAGLEFGSRYGAMEFGALGQMSSSLGGGENGSSGAQPFSGAGYGADVGFHGGFHDGHTSSMVNSRNNSISGMNMSGGGPNFPNTYTIAAGTSSLTSPSPPAPSPQAVPTTGVDGTGYGSMNALSPSATTTPTVSAPSGFFRPPLPGSVNSATGPFGQFHRPPMTNLQRRAKFSSDPSLIYQSVTKPYSYVAGYHRLFHFIQTHFPKQSIMRIARSIANFRPSFIACTQTLKEPDLIFMEKCFQRTLLEYESFIYRCGTPTIVFRRTGEVAAVGKEFCILTGWTKEVLLGEKPNLNVNFSSSNPSQERNISTPQDDDNQNKPVSIAELLDEESVVQFYEEFARMAFGDSRGAVRTRCKIMKYKPRTDGTKEETSTPATAALGGKDGKLHCTFCWTIKRDVFDIPMLIVANFLPILDAIPSDDSNN